MYRNTFRCWIYITEKEIIVKINSTKADITPTQANITGIQSKNENDSTANDGVKMVQNSLMM